MAADKWPIVGTVVGSTSTHEYSFILRSFRASVGDIVAVVQDIPIEGTDTKTPVTVWGRVVTIERFNPFFPVEAAQELSEEGLSIDDTVLSTARDQLQASVLILGFTRQDDRTSANLWPLNYPVQPAAKVLYPDGKVLEGLLSGERKEVPR